MCCPFEAVARGGRTVPLARTLPTTPLWGLCRCVDGMCVCVRSCVRACLCIGLCAGVYVCVWCFIDSFYSLVIFSLSAGIPFVRSPLRSFMSVFPTFRKNVRSSAPTVVFNSVQKLPNAGLNPSLTSAVVCR